MISAIAAGLAGHIPVKEIMHTFISGMGGNSETALSYILLGAFAASMTHTGLAPLLAKKIAGMIKSNKYLLLAILTGIAILSQNLIPVHIAFIPIIIPPLLQVMNKLKIDRRAVACALAYGLKTPYIVLPAGFGLIFQGLLADNITQNGMTVLKSDIWHYTFAGYRQGSIIRIIGPYKPITQISYLYSFFCKNREAGKQQSKQPAGNDR